MTAPVRLGLYGLVLVVVFALSAVIAGAVVPEETVQNWVEQTEEVSHYDTAGDIHDQQEGSDHDRGE